MRDKLIFCLLIKIRVLKKTVLLHLVGVARRACPKYPK